MLSLFFIILITNTDKRGKKNIWTFVIVPFQKFGEKVQGD